MRNFKSEHLLTRQKCIAHSEKESQRHRKTLKAVQTDTNHIVFIINYY